MSGNSHRGSSDGQLDSPDSHGKGRGRVRRCKHCKFSCTDAKEFFHHQMMEHDEENDQSFATPNKGLPKLTPIRKRASQSISEDTPELDEEKNNGDTIVINNMVTDDEEEDGRLVIAEQPEQTEDGSNSESTVVTPTRCGNIQNRTYVCSGCDFSSTSAKVFLNHQKDAHNFDIIIYECDICDYATKYKQKLPRHRKLHFSGQDFLGGEGMAGEMDEFSGNGCMDDTFDNLPEEDELPEDSFKDLPPLIDSNTVVVTPTDPDDVIPEKKTKKRQEVDPAKYFEVVDDTGCKYACSSCGNVYKWRKSLNKHWKEKHGGEMPDNSRKPPGLVYLVNSGGHTICGRRKILANSVLSKNQNGMSMCETPNSSHGGTPMSSSTDIMNSMSEHISSSASPISTVIPSFIGPFVTHSVQPVYPETSTPNGDKSKKSRYTSNIRIQGQHEPLDFSVKKDDEAVMQSSYVKAEPEWETEDAMMDDGKDKAVLQCTKCSFVAKTLVDYSSHMTLHLNKRAFKCAECQEHFNGVDDLNVHFAEVHANRIQEHKEAIQRIPHGLQQTYHLLKMPLNAITSLSSQDLTTSDNKKLKCNMCSFVAKWPAELQKHAVSHSEERPFMCMVCGSTYKWKWDLVKHFEKSHHTLPNPYKRRELNSGKNGSSPSFNMSKSNMSLDDEALLYKGSPDIPPMKKRRLSDSGMDELDRLDEDENRNSLSHLTDLNIDVNGLANIGRSMALANNRPSSLPRLSDMEMDDEDSLGRMHSLQEREALLGKRPINETTQKAVAAAVLNRLNSSTPKDTQFVNSPDNSSVLLPYKCQRCEYRARWPSEITQHMKNHSEDKPYLCPRCSYRSKWKWDVVKHLKRCGGGGTIKDVIDTTKGRKTAPPNVMVMPEGQLQQQTPQPNNYSSNYQRLNDGNNSSGSIASMTKIMDKQDMEKHGKYSGNGGKKPVFRSLINDGLYYCLECQFVGTSPAELKRHAVLHSENKPFTCEVCGYSSGWKCDLKKHMKTYNHYTSAAQMLESQASDHNQSSDIEETDHAFRCQKCYFSTDQVHLFKAHLQVHENAKSQSTPGRFKCKQCPFQVNDLASFVQHRVTHTECSRQSSPTPSQNSPASQLPESPKTDMDEARIKHPRKQIKTFHCSKCDFVCKRRDLLESHEIEHDDEEAMLKCVYCEASYKDKDSLLDHISTHSEFNPDEWETFFMEEDEPEENNNEQMESLQQSKNGSSLTDTPRLASALAAGPQYLNKNDHSNQPQKLAGGIIVPANRKFTCEWCDATFAHVTTLYNHGKNVHPIEMSAQEMAESARDFLGTKSNKSSQMSELKHQQQSSSQVSSYLGGNQYLVNPSLITSQVLSQVPSVNKERPILPNTMDPMKSRRTISPQKKAKSFQCTKCPFTAPNAVTYLRHIERHGSNCKHNCWFCDYSIDRLNLLYQHMKGTHTEQWRNTAATGDVSPKSDRDSKDSISIYSDNDSSMQMSPKSSPLNIIEEIMLKGVPVQICTYDGKKVFKCKKCTFISSNAGTTTNHARQHASTPRSNPEQRGENVQAMNNLVKALRAQKEKNKVAPNSQTQCSKCPFKSLIPERLLKHSMYHNYDGEYRCKQCDYSCDKVEVLTQHVQLHENNQPTKEDSKSFIPLTSTYNRIVLNKRPAAIKDSTSKLLSIQARTSLNKSRRIRYKCSRCPYNTFCKNNMVKHRKQHIIKSRFRCPICNYSATRDYLLYQHMKFHGGDTEQMIKQMKDKKIEDVVMDPFDDNNSPNSNQRTDEGKEDSMASFEEIVDKSTESESLTGDAEEMMNGEDSMSCTECPFAAESNTEFEQHMKLHFCEDRYKCDHCTLSMDRLKPLLEHRYLHEDEPCFDANPPTGNLWNKAYSDGVSSTSCNQNREGVDDTKEEMRYVCETCPYKCNSLKSYNVHTSMHGVNKKFICDFCNWSVDRLNLLYQHRRVHSKEPGFDNNPEEIIFMNREYALGSVNKDSDESSLGMEEELVKDEMFHCEECPFTTANKNSFTNHQGLHNSPARHKCSDCSYSVDKWSLMCQHRKLHAEKESPGSPSKKRLKCPKCPYHSHNGQLLENHMKMHASGHKYSCGLCDYSIDQQNLLQQHMKVHNDTSKQAKVPNSSSVQVMEPGTSKITCPKLYFSSTDDVVMSDASEEEFKCDRCPFSTPSKQQFEDHESRHNFKNRVSCPYCDFSSTTDNQILEHIQVHFPGTPKDSLKLMLEKRQKEPNNNTDANDKMAQKVTKRSSKAESEPDSTVSESQKSQQSEEKQEKTPEAVVEQEESDAPNQTTKVYVCQYCEREFNKKSNMIQHERQHLIGHQY